MVEDIELILKLDLENWYLRSGLTDLYVVGSYSTNETNQTSDVDLLGISPVSLSQKRISELKNELKNNNSALNYGLRIRTTDELIEFSRKAKSWGYDIYMAITIFGREISSILRKRDVTAFEPTLIFDNLIEKAWYDLLFMTLKTSSVEKSYLIAKSYLDLVHFILYLNDIFLPTHQQRVDFVLSNSHLLNGFVDNIDDIKLALNVKQNPDKYIYQIDLDVSCHTLINRLYKTHLSAFRSGKKSFGQFRYWTYNPNVYIEIPEILEFLNIDKSHYHESLNFNWRLILITLLLKIDLFRLSNSLDEGRKLITSILNVKFRDAIGSHHNYLVFLENLRIDTSIEGKDYLKK